MRVLVCVCVCVCVCDCHWSTSLLKSLSGKSWGLFAGLGRGPGTVHSSKAVQAPSGALSVPPTPCMGPR